MTSKTLRTNRPPTKTQSTFMERPLSPSLKRHITINHHTKHVSILERPTALEYYVHGLSKGTGKKLTVESSVLQCHEHVIMNRRIWWLIRLRLFGPQSRNDTAYDGFLSRKNCWHPENPQCVSASRTHTHPTRRSLVLASRCAHEGSLGSSLLSIQTHFTRSANSSSP